VKEDEDYARLLRQRCRERFCDSTAYIVLTIILITLILLFVPYLLGHYVICEMMEHGCDWSLIKQWGYGLLGCLSWGAGLIIAIGALTVLICFCRNPTCRPATNTTMNTATTTHIANTNESLPLSTLV
jgi:hypothetical protein